MGLIWCDGFDYYNQEAMENYYNPQPTHLAVTHGCGHTEIFIYQNFNQSEPQDKCKNCKGLNKFRFSS